MRADDFAMGSTAHQRSRNELGVGSGRSFVSGGTSKHAPAVLRLTARIQQQTCGGHTNHRTRAAIDACSGCARRNDDATVSTLGHPHVLFEMTFDHISDVNLILSVWIPQRSKMFLIDRLDAVPASATR
eukprot:2209706-Rhodomonas_salina.2